MWLAKNAYMHDNVTDSDEPKDRVHLSRGLTIFDRRLFFGPRATTRDILDTLRVLVEEGQSDPMIGSTWCDFGDPPSVFFGWQGPPEPFLWLLRQDHFDVDIEGQNKHWDQSIFHFQAGSRFPCGPRLILDALFEEKHYPTLIRARDFFGHTVLHQAVKTWCGNVLSGEKSSNGREVTVSYTLVQRLLEIRSDVHAQNKMGYTPLNVIFNQFLYWKPLENADHHHDEQLWRSLIGSWLAALVNAGYNLREYAETEQSLNPSGIHQHSRHIIDRGRVDYTVRIIFVYGEDPNDVEIGVEVLEDGVERNNDSFQEMEEPLKIPGSWQ